ncbi:solute carrier family 46 member 2-like [Pelobates fuscus]|uniref:solute carrier family 46 member 2-like n=1 Tax=Pelobates fuscus TaxID=191477 RepID=UPI002FE47E40
MWMWIRRRMSCFVLLPTIAIIRTWIDPIVAGAQVASSFYDTGLLLAVKNHYNHTIDASNSSSEDALQKAISNFYIIHNLILGLAPLLSAYILARISDKGNRKITICVPLAGYLISRLFLLFVILWDWPIEIMYGSAALNGLTGWFTAYWSGVMAWASRGSSESRRSLRLIIVELVYGLAGFIGSLASGHIFVHFQITRHNGVVLVSCSLALYLFCLLYSIFVLKPPHVEGIQNVNSIPSDSENKVAAPTENSRLLGAYSDGQAASIPAINTTLPPKVLIALLFTGAIFYNVAVSGAVDVLPFYVIKEPLSWGPVFIGYGSAAGYLIFITSFLAVYILSGRVKDLVLTCIGIVSFCAGIIIMAFVQKTYLYYIARAVMMFSLIPLPTIRSVLSKQVQGSSYGKIFVVLQFSLAISAVITSIAFNKIYQATLQLFSGSSFILSAAIAALSLIPIGIAAYKYPKRPNTEATT